MSEEGRKRSLLGGGTGFWIKNTLETIAVACCGALFLLVVYAVGNVDYTDSGSFLDALLMLPYYLYLAGGFTILMVGIGYFQAYFFVLVSMNVTRKAVLRGIVLSMAAAVLSVTALAALIWKLLPGADAATCVKLTPLFLGALFLTGAFGILLGVITARWGKIGMIILTVIGAVTGALFGAGIVVSLEPLLHKLMSLEQFNLWSIAGAGVLLYGAAGIFAAAVTGKLEVRS